jgi:hypothetical protein
VMVSHNHLRLRDHAQQLRQTHQSEYCSRDSQTDYDW